MWDSFRHKAHLLRVALLFVCAFVAFVVLQAFLVPKDFGRYGHYRAGALRDARERPLVFAGRAACLDCHSDAGETLRAGKHAAVRCEACHGPLGAHAKDPSAQPGVKPDPATLCARCHEEKAGRPASFPQVEVKTHAAGASCTSCHLPHDPLGTGKGKTR